MNKGITVKRNLSTRELFKWSLLLSQLIQQQIIEKIDSIWIAQREGRAKDGNDLTQPGVLKMLTLADKSPFLDQIKKLHIVPVAISYEYDPCDFLKARELYITATQESYKKSPGEDTQSMILGVKGHKGKIHIQIGLEINSAIEKANQASSKRDQVIIIAEEIDAQIHKNYKNWPSNFIAFDLLEGKGSMKEFYSEEKKAEFLERMENQLSLLQASPSELDLIRPFFLKSYANSVKNSLAPSLHSSSVIGSNWT
jgi:hypothetical protein